MILPNDILLNVILVKEKVRPAMLIQPIDYNEVNNNGEFTKFILNEIKIKFPQLKQSIFTIGIIISYIDYSMDLILNKEKIGNILGYPCFNDKIKNYDISLYVLYNNNTKEYLFSNYSEDLSKIDQFNKYSELSKNIFNKYKDNKDFSLDFSKIKSVDIEIHKILS